MDTETTDTTIVNQTTAATDAMTAMNAMTTMNVMIAVVVVVVVVTEEQTSNGMFDNQRVRIDTRNQAMRRFVLRSNPCCRSNSEERRKQIEVSRS